MGLFSKKTCDMCGGDIGLLGNRKLEDGNMCKSCAKKLSPWFDERRHSTVEQIKQQLQYREENQQAVSNFRVARTYGECWELRIDEGQGKFMIVRGLGSIDEENPDVLDLDQVTGVELDIDENKLEEKRKDLNGDMVSYNPPRYFYQFDFYVVIRVRHPYFDDMKFQINRDTVEVNNTSAQDGAGLGVRMGISQVNMTSPREDPAYQHYDAMYQEIKAALLRQPNSQGNQPQQGGYSQQGAFQQGGGIPAAAVSATASAPAAASEPKFCPSCGAPASSGKFCENCGTALR